MSTCKASWKVAKLVHLPPWHFIGNIIQWLPEAMILGQGFDLVHTLTVRILCAKFEKFLRPESDRNPYLLRADSRLRVILSRAFPVQTPRQGVGGLALPGRGYFSLNPLATSFIQCYAS